MANTKIPVELSSTPGIVDNSNATAITIDSSENTTFSGNINLDLTAPTVVFKESGAAKFFIGESSGVGGGSGFYDLYAAAGVGQRFFTAAAERMRIDASGNLLVARTSDSGFGKLQVYGGADLAGGNVILCRDTGNVGIGQTSPYSHASFSSLSLGGTSSKGGLIQIKHSDDSAKGYLYAQSDAITLESVSTNIIRFVTNSAERARIDTSGNLLVGTTSGGAHLVIGGNSNTARVLPATDNVGYIGESVHRWQAIYAVTGSIQTSDEREKTEIKETTLGLDFIKDLKPVSYKWIDGEQQNKGKDKREHQGLIAQQVAETVEKHGIDKNTFGGLDIQKTEKYDDFHGMSYDQFVAPLIKAIQEQQEQIEALQSEINELKNS